MNETVKKFLGQGKALWGKWSVMQRAILVGIAAIAVIGIIALFSVSASPSLVAVIDAPIRDEDARDRIVTRINEEGVRAHVTATGLSRWPTRPQPGECGRYLFGRILFPGG